MKTGLASKAWRRVLALLTALLVSGLVAVPAALADTQPPQPPTGVALTPAEVSEDGQVVLNWRISGSSDVAGYRVYRSQGSGTPVVNETTYLDQTTDAYFIDVIADEGEYRYAVVAVDQAGNRSRAALSLPLTVNLPANGRTVAPDRVAPAAPTDLEAVWATAAGNQVDLSWVAPADSGIWRYLVYRAEGSSTALFVAYVDGSVSFYTDEVAADHAYTYQVMAQDRSGNLSPASASAQVVVDRVAPVVTITAPSRDLPYQNAGLLAVTAAIVETGAGYEPDAVKVYLDNDPIDPVIDLAEITVGTHRLEVKVTDRAGNTGRDAIDLEIRATAGADAPRILTASGFTRNRQIQIRWEAPATAGVTGYTVYRSHGGTDPVAVGTTGSATRSYSTAVPSDGDWSFYVAARYGRTSEVASNAVALTVDLTAPKVTISSPEDGKSYTAATRTVPVTYAVDDALYTSAATVTLLLDGRPFTGTAISLTGLAAGQHSLKVTAADRAGNQSSALTQFTIDRTTGGDTGGGDEDDDDDEDEDGGNGKGNGQFMPGLQFSVTDEQKAEILAELALWAPGRKSEGARTPGNRSAWKNGATIQQGHYKALLAKVEAGAWRSFVFHLYKHSGKFIPAEAAENLLELIGADDLQIDPGSIPDSEIEGWGNGHGNGKGPGKND